MDIKEAITFQKEKPIIQLDKNELACGEIIFINGQCQVLSQSPSCYEVLVNNEI